MLSAKNFMKPVGYGSRFYLNWKKIRHCSSASKFMSNCSKSTVLVKNIFRGTFIPQKRWYSDEKIELTFVNRKGQKTVVKASHEDTLLDVVIDNNMDIESFGVCEGTLGCSTCHVILEKSVFELMDKICPPTAEEMDMLDMACGLTETSRLGCQIEVTSDLKGCTIKIPEEAVDARDL